jgi:NAD(P)-dependent dehydrogenase (short-subunit alcohol dehydrogenase family)
MNIIITGASRGIGREVASILASQDGNLVIAVARNGEKLTELRKELPDPSRLIPLPYDLQNGDYDGLARQIRVLMPEVNVLINNAGALVNKKISQLKEDDFDLMMTLNVKAAFFLSQSLIPVFETNGHIVNISSMGGFQGSAKFPGLSLYSASKGALAILSECMAEELKEYKISVNCLALGAAQTEMLAEAFPGYKAPISAGEMGTFVADFAINGHKYFNGKILPISLSTP